MGKMGVSTSEIMTKATIGKGLGRGENHQTASETLSDDDNANVVGLFTIPVLIFMVFSREMKSVYNLVNDK